MRLSVRGLRSMCAMSFCLFAVAACGDDDAPPVIDAGVADAAPDATRTDAGPIGRFRDGPYGVSPYDVAGPFTVPTTDGPLDFEAAFTGDDSWIFVVYAPGSAYGESLWNSNVDYLLEDSPDNVHFVFMSYFEEDRSDRAAEHVMELETRVDAALAALPPDRAAHWQPRMHYVTTEALGLGNWVSDMLNTRAEIAFAIDRQQQLREVGLLQSVTAAGPDADLFFLAFEARHFNMEWERAQRLAAETATTIVPVVARATLLDGDLDMAVTLPAAATMASFDTLEVDLDMSCNADIQRNCWEWDRIATLRLCTGAPGALTCDIELARAITTYGRASRWVMDVTPMLALLNEGGARTLRFNAGPASGVMRPYIVDISLRLSNRARGRRPVSAERVYVGTRPFDTTYDASFTPHAFTPPAGTTRTELFAFITGHGFATEPLNCAEFCNHEHHFAVNGTTFTKDNIAAGTSNGCVETVGSAELQTVPNQYGTWPFGRAGWCPGAAVVPYSADLTAVAPAGTASTLTYTTTVDGTPFVPMFTTDGYRPEIALSVWLVYWQ